MPRIFKGSESTLRLLIHTCNQEGTISDLKIALYTSDPSMAVEFTDRYIIEGNIVSLTVPNYAFGTMEDGVINYIAQGMIEDDTFLTERQSNYFLKTPANYTPAPMPGEIVLGELTAMIERNGTFKYRPEDVDAWERARIEVNVPDTNGSYDEGYDKGKNDGYDSGYQDGYNAGQPIQYNTIGDIYGSPTDSTVKFKGLVALSFAYGSGYYILFTDHTGSILLRNHKDLLMVGDECVVTAKVRRTDNYISFLVYASVEVLSSNNYVVMPADAVELTDVDELYIPNENGYAEMKYLYVDGKVFGNPTETFIQLETDASSSGNISLRGDFNDWVEKLKEGDSIRVYMFTDSSTNTFDVKDIIELGTEGGSCNLEDKWVTPSMGDVDGNGFIVVNPSAGYDGLSRTVIDPSTIYNEGIEEGKNQGGGESDSCNLEDKWVNPSMGDVDGNGLIVVSPSEGYDGLSRTVIDPQTIYNEGLEAGKAEGGDCPELTTIDITENGSYEGAFSLVNVNVPQEGDSCNLGVLDWTLDSPYGSQKNASDDGYDGYSAVVVRPENIIAREKEYAIIYYKNQMNDITITENGTYSIDDVELQKSIIFDGNSYFDTGIIPTEDIKIEVCIKITEGIDAGLGGTIIGGGIDSINNQTENRGIAIGMGGGAIYGKWGTLNSWNNPYNYESTTTVVLQKTDDSWGWDGEKGVFGAASLYIGGYNKNGEEVEDKFMQSIVYIKIWTDRNDDSTLITYVPNTNGNFDANGVELQKIGDGTTTYVEESVNIYPNGFKRVEVNIPTIQDSAKDYYYCPLILGDTGLGEAAKSWTADMITFNDYDGNIIGDKLYVPTYGNRNEFRTKTKAKFIQTIKNTSAIGTMEFGDGVEYFVTSEGKQFTNLTDLTIGSDMNTVNFGPSTFPTLKRIWCFSEIDNINVYFSIGSSFYDTGTLYLKNHNQETEWKNSLPSGWTIVLL